MSLSPVTTRDAPLHRQIVHAGHLEISRYFKINKKTLAQNWSHTQARCTKRGTWLIQ